jgi:hypothetical protein
MHKDSMAAAHGKLEKAKRSGQNGAARKSKTKREVGCRKGEP